MAFYKIDNDSVNSITNALDFFHIPPTNVSVSSAKVFEILPSNPLTDTPYHFKIHSSDNYIDPTKCFLFSEFRIVKKTEGGTSTVLTDADKVAPVQLLGNTFIRDMRIAINGREIFNSNSLMAYKSYFTHELSYSSEAKKSHLTAAGYTPDEMDESLEKGKGFEARMEQYKGSKTVQMISKLDADIFNQELYLISHLGMDITIMPNTNNFLLISQTGTTTYTLELTNLKLYVKKVSLLDGLALDIAKRLDTKPVKYHIRKSMMKSMFISAGRYEFTANLFQDQIPRRIIMGLVKNSDYVGDMKTSPFNFQPFGVREISIIANGRQYPQAPFNLDYANDKYVRAFHETNDAIGFTNTSGGNGINRKRFGSTHCIYVFNLTNSGDDQGGVFDLIKNGTTAVNIHFSTPVEAGGYMLIIYAEVDSLLMLDKNRTITSDTTI